MLVHADERITIAAACRRLPVIERKVLYLRFAEDLSQTAVAARIGVSQMQVSRLERTALGQLRELAAACTDCSRLRSANTTRSISCASGRLDPHVVGEPRERGSRLGAASADSGSPAPVPARSGPIASSSRRGADRIEKPTGSPSALCSAYSPSASVTT